MDIAFVIDRYRAGKGGLEAWFAAFAAHLSSRGHRVHLVSQDVAAAGLHVEHHGVRGIGFTRRRRDRRFALAAAEFCAEAGFDRVVGLRHCLWCDVYYPHGGTAAATFEGRTSGKARALVALEEELLGGDSPPAAVVAVSESVRRDVEARYPRMADRIRVVPNGVDLERFTPEGREEARRRLAPEGGRVVLFVAGNPLLKGWRAVRETFDVLRDQGLAHTLLTAGGEPGRLPEGGRYLGRLEHPEEAYRAADVLLHPTAYDPFPLVTLEALACGTPVATTRANGAVDHTGGDGPVRAVADAGDIDGLVAAVGELLASAPRGAARDLAQRFPLDGALTAAEAAVTGLNPPAS